LVQATTAKYRLGVEVADAGILQNSIGDSVKSVALAENLCMDCCPLRETKVARIAGVETCKKDEVTAPGGEMVEVACRRTSNDSIVVVREHLGSL
jgi:hypothetical protein